MQLPTEMVTGFQLIQVANSDSVFIAQILCDSIPNLQRAVDKYVHTSSNEHIDDRREEIGIDPEVDNNCDSMAAHTFLTD
jgi:hypothetical protein